jgi:hypothetical protein
MKDGFKIGGKFFVQCFGPDGKLKWEDEAKNLVTNEGLNHILDVVLHAAAQETTWYVGLTDGTPTPAAADVMTSHAGWTEVDAYTGDRKEYDEAAASSQSITNSASKASFAIDADSTTIGGAFLTAAATGTADILLCVAAFTGGDKSADNGDTLEVTYTISAADA